MAKLNLYSSDAKSHGTFADSRVKTLCFAGLVPGVTGYATYYDTHHPMVDSSILSSLPAEEFKGGVMRRFPVEGYTLEECALARWQGVSGSHYEGSGWVKSREVTSYFLMGTRVPDALEQAKEINDKAFAELHKKRDELLSTWGIVVPRRTVVLWDSNEELVPVGYQPSERFSATWADPYYFSVHSNARTLEEYMTVLKQRFEKISEEQESWGEDPFLD